MSLVRITTTGIERLMLTLEVASTMLDDLTPLMRQFAGILADTTETAFETEKDPDGKPWKTLAEATADKIISGKRRGEHPILQVSGMMAASAVTEYGRTYAQIGTNKVQAALQQFGGLAGRASPSRKARRDRPFRRPRIAARAFIGVGPMSLGKLDVAASSFLAKKLGG